MMAFEQYQLFGSGPSPCDLNLVHQQTPTSVSTPLRFRLPRDCPSVESNSTFSDSSGFSTPININKSPPLPIYMYEGGARRNLIFQLDPTVSWMADSRRQYNPMPKARATQTYSDDKFVDDDLEQVRRMIVRPNRVPPPGYVCHICYQTDHYISRCPVGALKEDSNQTPYQGPKKCYGDFMCPKCKRPWQSTNSYANAPQKCIKCAIPVLPRKQFALERALAMNLIVPKPNGTGYFPVGKNKRIQWSTQFQ